MLAEEALLSLLASWKDYRHYTLAREVFALSGRFLRRHPPIDDLLEWHALASRQDPLSVAALLAAPVRADLQALRRLLATLAEFPPDPRLAVFGRRWADKLTEDDELKDEAFSRAMALWQMHGPIREGGPDPGLAALPPSEEQALLLQGSWPVYADWLMEQGDPFGELLARGDIRHQSSLDKVRWFKHHLGRLEVQHGAEMPDLASLHGHVSGRPSLVWARAGEVSLVEPTREDLLWARDLPDLHTLWLSYHGPGAPARLSEAERLFAQSGVRKLGLVQPCWRAGEHGAPGTWPRLEVLDLPFLPRKIRLDQAFLGPRELELTLTWRSWGTPLLELVPQLGQASPRLKRVHVYQPRLYRSLWLERDAMGQLRRLRLSGWVWISALQDLLRGQVGITEVVGRMREDQREEADLYLAPLGARFIEAVGSE